MEDMHQVPVWATILMTLGGGVLTFLGIYANGVIKSKNEANRDIRIAEINSEGEEYSRLKKDLHDALDAIKALKTELVKEKDIRVEITRKFEAVKLAFRIIFNEYAKRFKEDPEQLSMLQELKDIIDSDNE